MKPKNIVLTEPDYVRLRSLIDSSKQFRHRDAEHLDALDEELERAIVVKAGDVAHNVVTMNSRVRVKDLGDGRELTYQIVFPGNAGVAKNRISVLAPDRYGATWIQHRHDGRVACALRLATPADSCGGISAGSCSCSGVEEGYQVVIHFAVAALTTRRLLQRECPICGHVQIAPPSKMHETIRCER